MAKRKSTNPETPLVNCGELLQGFFGDRFGKLVKQAEGNRFTETTLLDATNDKAKGDVFVAIASFVRLAGSALTNTERAALRELPLGSRYAPAEAAQTVEGDIPLS